MSALCLRHIQLPSTGQTTWRGRWTYQASTMKQEVLWGNWRGVNGRNHNSEPRIQSRVNIQWGQEGRRSWDSKNMVAAMDCRSQTRSTVQVGVLDRRSWKTGWWGPGGMLETVSYEITFIKYGWVWLKCYRTTLKTKAKCRKLEKLEDCETGVEELYHRNCNWRIAESPGKPFPALLEKVSFEQPDQLGRRQCQTMLAWATLKPTFSPNPLSPLNWTLGRMRMAHGRDAGKAKREAYWDSPSKQASGMKQFWARKKSSNLCKRVNTDNYTELYLLITKIRLLLTRKQKIFYCLKSH